jgi:hypothetical protein
MRYEWMRYSAAADLPCVTLDSLSSRLHAFIWLTAVRSRAEHTRSRGANARMSF